MSKNILVVDDIEENIEIAIEYLVTEGYKTDYSLNGFDALEKINSNEYDLILLDIMMPEMDGIELCTKIKSIPEKKDIPIIFLTALDDTKTLIEGFKVGAVDYLIKPINIHELDIRIKTHINLKKVKQELLLKNKELETKNIELSIKNKHITDSINYALRIQEAALPESKYIQDILGEHCILFKPRDIVSGDFYWVKQLENKALIAVGDCTGHGIPGAFMSMLGLSFLNEIVADIEDLNPALFLDELSDRINRLLKHNTNVKDGIDIAFIILDYETKKMQFAGSNASIAIVREGNFSECMHKKDKKKLNLYHLEERNLLTIKGSLQNVGYRVFDIDKIKTKTIQLKTGDIIYLYSDGYVDQLNNDNKRFSKRRFYNLLLSIFNEKMSKQKNMLEEQFVKWKAQNKQLDDIVVFGIKVQDSYGDVDLF